MPNDDRQGTDVPAAYPYLPERWPSAWPSLAPRVALGLTFPVVAALVALAVLGLTQTLAAAWWVAALPVLGMVAPLTLPARARSRMQRAADSRRLDVAEVDHGLLVRPRARGRANPVAIVGYDGAIRYRLAAEEWR